MERFEDLITSNIPVLVDFFAEWCGPCKAMKPILEELKGIKGEKVRIVKVDVDKHKEIAAYYQIQSVPTPCGVKINNCRFLSFVFPVSGTGSVVKYIIQEHLFVHTYDFS